MYSVSTVSTVEIKMTVRLLVREIVREIVRGKWLGLFRDC